MKPRKIVITNKRRGDYGHIYTVYNVEVTYQFQIDKKTPTPSHIDLKKSQFKYVKETNNEK